MTKSDRLEVLTRIEEAQVVLLVSHLNPDGDNIGSTAALYDDLIHRGKEVYWYGEDAVPDFLQFVPHVEKRGCVSQNSFDLAISLDCADLERMGKGRDLYESADLKINIDHHKTNTMFGDYNIVETLSSTCEVLYRFLGDQSPMTPQRATAYFTGLSSDTGSFKYDATTEETLLIAADLLRQGADLTTVSQNLYMRRSLSKTRLWSQVLPQIQFLSDNRVAYLQVSLAQIEQAEAEGHDTEGLVEFLRDTEGVEVAVLLKERQSGVKLSLRTKSYADATRIAEPFGGGGHIRAAGATLATSLEEAKDLVLASVEKELASCMD